MFIDMQKRMLSHDINSTLNRLLKVMEKKAEKLEITNVIRVLAALSHRKSA